MEMCKHTGIDIKRLNNWFVNNRIRIWKPRFEAMQKQQKKNPQVQQPATQALAIATPPQSTQSASEEGYLQAIKALAGKVSLQNSVTPTAVNVPRRVSLPLPTAASRLVHQISDVSLNASDSISTVSSSVSVDSNDAPKRSAVQVTSVSFQSPPRKRARFVSDATTPPTRYAAKDVEQWKQVCLSSPHLNDQSLPSFDEAACLFGYSSIVV